MPEVRVSRLILFLVLIGGGVLVFIFFGGAIAYWAYEAWSVARGYTSAKSPAEAMDKFRTAIQSRQYKDAARYTTKPYGEMLTRGHASAAELAGDIDTIHKFGENHGILSDKVKLALLRLDPFPKNFKVGPAPEEKKDGKAYGTFEWEPIVLSMPGNQAAIETELLQLDPAMYINILTPKGFFVQGKGIRNVQLVKEGEEWKIDVAVDDKWDAASRVYIDKHKTYHTGLAAFTFNMSRERYADKQIFENGIWDRLREARK
jgi:hypothetical protein